MRKMGDRQIDGIWEVEGTNDVPCSSMSQSHLSSSGREYIRDQTMAFRPLRNQGTVPGSYDGEEAK